MMRLKRNGKLALKHISPYEKVERVDKVAYRLALPANMNFIYDIFYVLLLRKYIGDLSHVLKTKEIQLLEGLSYEERPI